ncbi:hypothetical protein [Streptomyces nigrescens]
MQQGTWGHLKNQADFEITRLTYMGAGLAGLGLFGAGDLASSIFRDQGVLRFAFLACAFLTAACLALAWESSQRIRAEVVRDHSHELDASRGAKELPEKIRLYRRRATFLLVATAALFLAAAGLAEWW